MLSSVLPNVPWKKFFVIVRDCNFLKIKPLLLLLAYYIVTTVNAVVDGASMILLVDVVLSSRLAAGSSPVQQFLKIFPVAWSTSNLYLFIIMLFFLKALLAFVVTKLDGYMEAKVRQSIQERGLSAILSGDWEFLRDMRVGQRVGAITEEGTRASQFVVAIVRSIYGVITAVILSLMAVAVSAQVASLFLLLGVPILLILRKLFAVQGKIAEQLVSERQGFFASITERLTGLFEVKVENDTTKHLVHSLSYQGRLTGLEIRYWGIRAYITALNAVIPAVILLAFYLWALFTGQPVGDLLYYIAGVGVVGMRVINYVNIATSNIGNITAFSGSLNPVFDLFVIPQEANKLPIAEKVVAVKTDDVAYGYNGHDVLRGVTIEAGIGRPLVIRGPSGSGKTTLANIISGLYRPGAGVVIYSGSSGREYSAHEYRPKIGYVTQDIHLFHGSIRDNLAFSAGAVEDDFLRECLRKAGAEDFVRALGGIGAMLAEAGRSLSGGERRRMGIARVLTRNPDIIILDEVTAGLDAEKKAELIKTIKDLSNNLVVIIITHDADIASVETENVYTCRSEQ